MIFIVQKKAHLQKKGKKAQLGMKRVMVLHARVPKTLTVFFNISAKDCLSSFVTSAVER